MASSIRSKLTTVAAIAAAAVGGATIANAATSSVVEHDDDHRRRRLVRGAAQQAMRDPSRAVTEANGKTETLLTGDTADKVKAAALAKVAGTVERVETDADHGSPYEAHVRKADGSEVEVLVDSDFEVTAVNTMGGHP